MSRKLSRRLSRRMRMRSRTEPRVASIALLLDQPALLDEPRIAAAVERATGKLVEAGERADGRSCVAGRSPLFLLRLEERLYVVHDSPIPYFHDPAIAAAAFGPTPHGEALRDHVAWIAIDAADGRDGPRDHAEAYRTIGRTLAELWSDRVTALALPEAHRVLPAMPRAFDALRDEDPFSRLLQLAGDVAVRVECDDQEIAGAIEEAKRRWPEFLAAFRSLPAPVEKLVLVRWADGGSHEHLWGIVHRIEGERITCTIDNEPNVVRNVQADDCVVVGVDQVLDWMWCEGARRVGGFTVAVLERRMAGGG